MKRAPLKSISDTLIPVLVYRRAFCPFPLCYSLFSIIEIYLYPLPYPLPYASTKVVTISPRYKHRSLHPSKAAVKQRKCLSQATYYESRFIITLEIISSSHDGHFEDIPNKPKGIMYLARLLQQCHTCLKSMSFITTWIAWIKFQEARMLHRLPKAQAEALNTLLPSG